jgi:tetratricopeptide (TPR) repeat protein
LADKEKRQAAFDDLIDRGRASLAGKRYKEALAILEPAARMMPDDRQGQRLLRDAREGLKTAKTSNARLLGLANDASRLGRYDEAQRLLEEATRNWPEDDVAEKALRNATRQMEAAQIAQANYLRYTQQGTLAMTAGRYAEAVAAFAEALRLAPLDLDVQRNLREARAALERDLRVRADYERLYRAGNLALVRRSFPEAIRAFTDALKLVPGDLPASEGLRKARYGKAILDGTVALKMRKKAEAVAAFEAALAEMPTDLAARQGLAQARSLR